MIEPWTVTDSEYVLRDQWITVRADSCVTPDGVRVEPYYVLEYPDWVYVVAVDRERNILLTRLYRHGNHELSLEIPAGSVDDGETPLEAARRELLEETGYTSEEFQLLASLTPNSATHANQVHCFLARDCYRVGEPSQDETENIEHEWVSASRLLEMIDNGEFVQALHIAGIYHAFRRLHILKS